MQKYRRVSAGLAVALFALGMWAESAVAANAVIHLGPIQPQSPGWGQTALFNAYVSADGRPVKNARVEFWFSGRHGIRTPSWFVYTDKGGRASFTATLPRIWGNYRPKTWADLNAACPQVGAFNIWRVKNK